MPFDKLNTDGITPFLSPHWSLLLQLKVCTNIKKERGQKPELLKAWRFIPSSCLRLLRVLAERNS